MGDNLLLKGIPRVFMFPVGAGSSFTSLSSCSLLRAVSHCKVAAHGSTAVEEALQTIGQLWGLEPLSEPPAHVGGVPH